MIDDPPDSFSISASPNTSNIIAGATWDKKKRGDSDVIL
jgi:hypothetical protein